MVEQRRNPSDLISIGLEALECLGEKQTLEALGVGVDDLCAMLLEEIAISPEVERSLLRLESILAQGRTTSAVVETPEQSMANVSRSEATAQEAELLPLTKDARDQQGSVMYDRLKADLYAARLIATRNLKDLRLRDDEILANQIVIYEIELTIIDDFGDSVPAPGMGWTKIQMHEESKKRIRELRATHAALQKYDRGMKGTLRRWVNGRRQTPREMLNDMLTEADVMRRAGDSERMESPQDLLRRVLEPAGLDADAVQKLLVGSRD